MLTDNAKVYRVGRNWARACAELGIRRRFTSPGCPWTNGKAELLTEFVHHQPWLSDTARLAVDAPTPPSAACPRSPA